MQADKLRELRELLADIGLGEWEAIGWHIRSPLSRGGWLIADCSGVTITSGAKVAMFIAALHNAADDLLAIAEGAEADRADAAIGRIVWKFIDRMNDVCEQDPADRIVAQFVAAVEPLMLAKIDALAGAVTQGEDHG